MRKAVVVATLEGLRAGYQARFDYCQKTLQNPDLEDYERAGISRTASALANIIEALTQTIAALQAQTDR